jgi:hypothetical protein
MCGACSTELHKADSSRHHSRWRVTVQRDISIACVWLGSGCTPPGLPVLPNAHSRTAWICGQGTARSGGDSGSKQPDGLEHDVIQQAVAAQEPWVMRNVNDAIVLLAKRSVI